MDLSKIPFLKNLDLSNAQTRKSALMLLGGVVAILVFILLNIPKSKDDDAKAQEQTTTQSSQTPPIQDGADKDNLQGKTLIEVRERKSDNGSFARRLFDESGSSVEDILRGTDSQSAGPVATSEGNTDTGRPLSALPSGDLLSNIESMAEADFQSRTSDLTAASSGQQTAQQTAQQTPSQQTAQQAPSQTPSASTRPSSTKTSPSARKSGGGGASRKYSDDPIERKRQHLIEMGFDPDTGLPLDQATPARSQSSSAQQVPSQRTTSNPPEGVEKSVVSVRSKGSMSSFGTRSESGSGSGFSSFGSAEQEAVSSGAKFFKVAFAYDEKIKAGQRVTLRLKEKITVNGYELPLNSIVYATSSIEGERLALHVRNIDINGKAFFLNYDAIDVDWEKGLYCPTKQSTKKMKEAVREGIQVVSSAAQGVITGVPGRMLSSGTSMVQNDSGEVTVTVREGYEFYLVPSEDYAR